jgi:hypothetical protein
VWCLLLLYRIVLCLITLYYNVLYCIMYHIILCYTILHFIQRTLCFNHCQYFLYVQTYSSASDTLDLNHYKLWYKVQNDRIDQETTRAKKLFKRNSKEQLSIERDLFKREKSVILNATGDVNQETLFCTQFVGRCVRSLLDICV